MTGIILKLIAAVSMAIDHAGLMLFPQASWMRAVGRLAFPIFAYFIAEGFYYTRSRLRYFLRIFLLGTACEAVYLLAGYPLELGILFTFSFSIILMSLLDRAKRALAKPDGRAESAAWFAAFLLCAAAIWFLSTRVFLDYGFFGVMLPVFTSLFTEKQHRYAAFAAGLTLLCAVDSAPSFSDIQSLSLAALGLLALYNGKEGRSRMKHFFYIFYPAHLAALWAIRQLTMLF